MFLYCSQSSISRDEHWVVGTFDGDACVGEGFDEGAGGLKWKVSYASRALPDDSARGFHCAAYLFSISTLPPPRVTTEVALFMWWRWTGGQVLVMSVEGLTNLR